MREFNERVQRESSMSKTIIHTENAPAAIGTYSQAVRVNSTIYLSGQIPLDPATMKMQDDSFSTQAHQVFKNLSAVSVAELEVAFRIW